MNLFEKEALVTSGAEQFENESPEAVIAWAVEKFPNITLACSFGAEDVVLVDMIQKISPGSDIFYLDTDFHFQETYETRDRLEAHYGMKFVRVSSKLTPDEQAISFG